MTGSLTLAIRFPTGQYHAHDAGGKAEWPPAPARVLAALLSTAYTTRNPAAIAAIRPLFTLSPPILWCPPVTQRNGEVSRWVPVDADLDPVTGKIGRGGLTGKILKPPERSTIVGDTPTLIQWDATRMLPHDLSLLDQLLPQVCYLGRPTCPVMITRIDMDAADLPALTTWTPDPRGRERLAIATEDLLLALDRREQEREAAGTPGLHPRLTIRPQARYTRTRPPGSTSETFTPASESTVRQVCAELAFYRTPGAAPLDVPAVLNALEITTRADALAVPILGETTRGGLASSRLFGVAATGVTPRPRRYLRGRELVDLAAPRPGVTSTTARRTIAAAWGASTAWTTLAPLPNDRRALLRMIRYLAQTHNAEVIDATIHNTGRDKNSFHTSYHPHLTHLSVLFDRLVAGPLIIDGTALLPIDRLAK